MTVIITQSGEEHPSPSAGTVSVDGTALNLRSGDFVRVNELIAAMRAMGIRVLGDAVADDGMESDARLTAAHARIAGLTKALRWALDELEDPGYAVKSRAYNTHYQKAKAALTVGP